jgi:hypothetical protein
VIPEAAPTPSVPPRPDRGARIGRRVASALYYAVAVAVALFATIDVSRQVFAPWETAPDAAPFQSCPEGLGALYRAVEAGRVAVELAPSGEIGGEDAALARFRAAVEPAWRHRARAAELCRGEPRLMAALDAVERLRYSEEHGVRHQAAELGALRRRVRGLVAEAAGRAP